jgi:YHS domain-containing protein
MKSVLLAGAALILATSAYAGEKAKKAPTEVKCAVMSDHKVNIKEATAKKAFEDYKGNRYFFCCAGCKPEFKKDPAKFAKADHIATPK